MSTLFDLPSIKSYGAAGLFTYASAAAQLEMALCNYAFQKVISKGYTPVCTPDLVKAAVLQRCGFQPRAESTQVC